jgi:WD40 repeat protein/HEAT repeat protein
MESQDNHHISSEHASQESGPEYREEKTLAAPTPAAILKRLRLGRPSLLPEMDETQLLAALESTEWQVRVAAVQKLEEYGELAPIERLVMALKDEHEAVRAAAAHALGVLGNPKAIIPLVDALQDVTWLVRSAVVQALGRLGEQGPVEPFTVAIHDEDETVRAVAVSALGTMGERVPTELLLTALQDSAWQVREMALLTLGVRGEHIPRATLRAVLQDEDESVRRAVYFLQETYPDRFAETIDGILASVSEENSGNAINVQLQIFRPATSSAEQQESYNGNPAASTDSGQPPLLFQATHELEQAGKREEGSNNLPALDDEQGQQSAVPYRNPQHYPRRGTMRALRLALLFCWSIFLGYLVSVIWNLVQLTRVDLAQLTAQVAIQALLAPLTALTELNVPVWVRGVCMLLALLLFFGCLWAARDTWYEQKWAHGQEVRREELEVGSGDHDQITRAPINPSQQIPVTRLLSRRAALVGLTTVLIVGNSIAWSLLLNSKRRQGSSGLALGTALYTYRRHTGNVRSVAWSPDNTRIASGSDDRTVQVWDAANGGHSFTYSGHASTVLTVAWSPDGRRIASAGHDGTVQVRDASTGRNVFTYRGHTGDAVTAVAWSPDGKRIASASTDVTVQVWEATNGGNVYTYRGHFQPVNAVVWSPNGKRIASGSWDGTVQVWDASTGRNVLTYFEPSPSIQSPSPVAAVAWSPDGKHIASGSYDKTVQVWDATSGGHVYTYRGHYDASLGFITTVAWSPDGRRIASGSDDKTVQVWDAASGDHSFIYRGHTNMVNTVAWSPDGKHIASGGDDRTVQVWDAG